jgi:hypothetical protein
MKALLREPLVHFLLAGTALFLLYGLVADRRGPGPERILVGEDRVALLARSFERTWMRPPSASELEQLVDDYVTEEVLYREALALGLDRDDLVVRRRMRQKMEFLNADLAAVEPSAEALRSFLAKDRERFRLPPRFSFEQVFLSPEREPLEERVPALLARLRAGEGRDGLGDATQLPAAMEDVTPSEVAGRFGADFAEALARAPEGAWAGPVDSAFGVHLVRVSERRPGRAPGLEEVRGAVEREWAAEQRARARERFYSALRSRYQVEVRMPPPAPKVASRP